MYKLLNMYRYAKLLLWIKVTRKIRNSLNIKRVQGQTETLMRSFLTCF